MRVKNKEIRQRRHRKEQTIKAAIREAKQGAKPEKKVVAPAPEKPAAKKAAPKKSEGTEKKPAAKKATKKADAEAPAAE
ncbi:MAG: hypothetical protein IT203_07530 [Fimbriimonadaceae bacterium]|nr:hypothetical protein [Fimbriimonadaceae bacterium]